MFKCDNCGEQTNNTGDQAAGIILCDACKADPARSSGESVGNALERQAREAADPRCRECGGAGLIGWGLTAGGKAYALVPCIRCRMEEYAATTAALVVRCRERSAAAAAR